MARDDEKSKRIEILLAGYKSSKDEIARRSALQWAILAVQGFVLYAAFNGLLKQSVGVRELLAWPVVAWATSLVTLLFHTREQLEIMRLSNIIKVRIECRLQELDLGGLLFERWGFNDCEAKKTEYPKTRAGHFDGVFKISVWAIAPALLTVMSIVQQTPISTRWAVVAAASIVLTCAIGVGYLLGQ